MNYKVIMSRNAWTFEEDLNTYVASGWKLHSFAAHRSIKDSWQTEYTAVLERMKQ